MKKIAMILFIPVLAFSQADKSYISKQYNLERMGSLSPSTQGLFATPPSTPGVTGSPFLFKNFALSTLSLKTNEKIDQIWANYHLETHEFYFQTNGGLRVIPAGQVTSFIAVDSLTRKKSLYVNATEFKSDKPTKILGFFEILVDGKIALLKQTSMSIQKPNFNPALNVGSKDYKIIKSTRLYYYNQTEVKLLPSKDKLSLFESRQKEVENFVKRNKLNLKNENHLFEVFNYFNGLN